MAMTPEVKVKKVVVKHLNSVDAYYFYPVTGGFGASGVPDIVGCYKGKFFGIECKANGNKPTVLQCKNLCAISVAGGMSLLIDENNLDMLEFYITGKQTFNIKNIL